MSSRPIPLFGLVVVGLVAAITHGHASAQDVEMLAREYGTTVPAAYYSELQRDPDAYRFGRGWRPEARADAGRLFRMGSLRGAATLGRREGGVSGTFTFPLILGLFLDTPGIPAGKVGCRAPCTVGPPAEPLTRKVI